MSRFRLVRHWWRSYHGVARRRAFYWYFLRGYDAEVCTECGRPVGLVWWCHDDFLWQRVTGNLKRQGSKESAAGVWCIRCFDDAARAVCGWIEWAPLNLRHLETPAEEERTVRALREKRGQP